MDPYRDMLPRLMRERDRLSLQLQEIDTVIGYFTRKVGVSAVEDETPQSNAALVREAVIECLESAGEPLTTSQIKAAISDDPKLELPHSSTLPTILSRAHASENVPIVRVSDGLWNLEAPESEQPEGHSDLYDDDIPF